MAFDPTKLKTADAVNVVPGVAAINAVTGNSVTNAAQSAGDKLGASNPFRSPNIPDVPGIVAPANISAPNAPTGGPAQVGPLGSMTGGQIQVPGAPAINSGDSAFRQNQLALVNQLAGQAAGTGPSVAADQLRMGQEANIAATMAAANSARGASAPAMARTAMQTSAEIQGKAAQEAATARLQEQMQAAGLLGQVAGQAREGDLGQAQMQNAANLEVFKGNLQAAIAQGQLDQSTAETMYEAEAQKQSKNAELQNAYMTLQAQYAAMGMDAAKANQMASLQVQQLTQQGILGQAGLIQQQDAAKKTMFGNLASGIGSGVAAIATSDVSAKTNIDDGDPAIRMFLDNIEPYEYDYKDPKHGEGRYVSPMAQDLLKTDLGASMVVEDEDGVLAVDYGRGFGALLAAQASLNKRLAKIEEKN